MIDKSILICIYNYRRDENAREWKNILSPHFNTVVLDSGNTKKCEDFIQFPNIYYSGLFNETKKMANTGNYKWIGVIPSDITIEKQYVYFLIEKIKWLKATSDIGIWQPSLDKTSRNWLGNINTDKYELEKKKVLEAHIFFIRKDILEDIPMIDLKENKYGYGVSEVLSGMSLKKKLNNVFDNTLQVHHPAETAYNTQEAIKESALWTPAICKKLGLDYSFLVNSNNNSLGKYIGVNEKIIITMTSWKNRINNIPTVLDTIFNQTILPDKIVINLSSAEFTNKERDFSNELKNYLKEHADDIVINWVDGPNIKSWKKTIPTFSLYPDDAIICIDDDFIYDSDFISTLWNAHLKNPEGPITWATYKPKECFYQHCGCASLDKASYYPKDIKHFLETDIVNYCDEDSFMTYMAAKNGTPTISIGKPFVGTPYNATDPLSYSGSVGPALKWIEAYYRKSIEDIYCEMNNLNNNKIKKSKKNTKESVDSRASLLTLYIGKDFTYPFKNNNTELSKFEPDTYSIGFKRFIDIAFENKYKWILCIKDSVRFIGVSSVSDNIKYIVDSKSNIGLYTPSAIYIGYNSPSARKYRSGIRSVNEISDDIFLVNVDALDGLKEVDFSMCRTGSGFMKYICSLVKSNGYSIAIDDSVCYAKNYANVSSDEVIEKHSAWFIRNNDIDTSILKTDPIKVNIEE